MYDFEDVIPRKKEEHENHEEYTENVAAEVTPEPAAEVQKDTPAEDAHTEHSEEQEAAPEEKEAEKKEETSRPGVREYHYEEQVKKTPKKKKGWAKFIAGCLIVSIAGGASVGVGYGFAQQYFQNRSSVTATPTAVQKGNGEKGAYSATEIIKAVKPSVVSVSTTVSGTTQYWGAFSVPYESQGVGSGVIFYSDDSKVAIATNNHVVENANSIYVTFEGDISVPAKVIGTKSESDLAVLTVSWNDLNDAGIEQVTTAVFGDSEAMEVGDDVIAIGNAMGMGLSATDGIISMTEQTINVDGNELAVLQTSAAINSGNSGGALVNSAGEVIGINTAKYNSSMAEGMGYAIPSNVITPIVEELLTTGTQPKPYIGITGTNITEETAPLYKLPVGALVVEVIEGGPADKAGLQVSDIITQYDGKPVMDMDSLVEMVNNTEIGRTVDMHVIREGSTSVNLKIKIGDKNS